MVSPWFICDLLVVHFFLSLWLCYSYRYHILRSIVFYEFLVRFGFVAYVENLWIRLGILIKLFQDFINIVNLWFLFDWGNLWLINVAPLSCWLCYSMSIILWGVSCFMSSLFWFGVYQKLWVRLDVCFVSWPLTWGSFWRNWSVIFLNNLGDFLLTSAGSFLRFSWSFVS